jgi:hypothetical protein
MKKRKIANAYEAWWFMHGHPKLKLEERHEVAPEEAAKLEAEGFWVTRDVGGKCYRMYRHLHRHALEENLSIHYAKVDPKTKTVEDDAARNTAVECWLEFGPLEYGYAYSGGPEPMADWDTETTRHHYHDVDLDTGGATFDEALVSLAKLVLKKYGDYEELDWPESRDSECGKPACGDCNEIGRTMKRLGLEKKEDKVKRA